MARERLSSKTPAETKRIARRMVDDFYRQPRSSGALVVGFSGALGAGKTAMIQEMGNAFGVRKKMQSPTFVFVKKYILSRRAAPWNTIFHIDAYRLSRQKDASVLGLHDILSDPRHIVFIEWAEKVRKFLPRNTVWVEVRHKGGNHRHIIVRNAKVKNQQLKLRTKIQNFS